MKKNTRKKKNRIFSFSTGKTSKDEEFQTSRFEILFSCYAFRHFLSNQTKRKKTHHFLLADKERQKAPSLGSSRFLLPANPISHMVLQTLRIGSLLGPVVVVVVVVHLHSDFALPRNPNFAAVSELAPIRTRNAKILIPITVDADGFDGAGIGRIAEGFVGGRTPSDGERSRES